MKGHPYVRDWFSLLGNAAALHTIYIMMNRNLADRGDPAGMVIWWISISLVYFLAAISLHLRNRWEPAVGAVIPGLGLHIMAVLHWGQAPGGLLPWLWTLLLWGFTMYRAVDLLYHPGKDEARLVDMEACVLLLIVAVAAYAGGVTPLSGVWPVGAGAGVTLLSLAIQRNHHPGKILMASLPLILVGILLPLLLPMLPAASRMVQGGWKALGTVGAFAGGMILRFFRWLMHFFSFRDSPVEFAEEAGGVPVEVSGGEGIPAEYAVAPALILVLVLGFLALIALGRSRELLRRPAGPGRGKQREKLTWWERLLTWVRDFLSAVGAAILSLREKIRYFWIILRNRHTPAGIFCQVEFAMKSKGHGRKPGESPRTFLARAAEIYPGREAEFHELTRWVEDDWFGVESSSPSGEEAEQLLRRLNI